MDDVSFHVTPVPSNPSERIDRTYAAMKIPVKWGKQ